MESQHFYIRTQQLRKIADIIAKSKHVCPVESDVGLAGVFVDL